MGNGLHVTWDTRKIRLKWHRLRRNAHESEFDPANLGLGLRLGASMEVDLQAMADGHFAVLHDGDLSGETDGNGPVALATRLHLKGLRLRASGREPLASADLANLLVAVHPDALLQLDMKNDVADVTAAHVRHIAHVFAPCAGHLIASGASEPLIAALSDALPGLQRGYDPTDALTAEPNLAAMERRLLACLRQPARPHMIYLNWNLLVDAAAQGLDMVALAHNEDVLVDAWTHALQRPETGFSDAEWHRFVALLRLGPDQITTNSPIATEAAVTARLTR